MFQKLLKNKVFKFKITKFYKENKNNIFDIILFGSAVRGKEEPKDIDILILFKNKEDISLSYNFRKGIEKFYQNVNVTIKTYDTLLTENFVARESFLSEGYSLIKNKFISNSLGYTNFILFKYELKGFNQSQRMMFQYSLYGRNKKSGMVKELSLIKFADSIILSPTKNSERTKEYLKQWNIKFEEIPILIPSRVNY